MPAYGMTSGLQGFPSPTTLTEVKRIKAASPNTPLILLTSCDDPQELNDHLANLAKTPAKEISSPSSGENIYNLSKREQQVLQMMVKGMINKEIAEMLSISYFTVENHQRKIYDKLKVHTRTAAVAKALLEKLV